MASLVMTSMTKLVPVLLAKKKMVMRKKLLVMLINVEFIKIKVIFRNFNNQIIVASSNLIK
jgi:hypothetical protein